MLMVGIFIFVIIFIVIVSLVIFLVVRNSSVDEASGLKHVKNKNWDNVIKVFLKIHQKDLKDPAAYYYLGLAYYNKELYDTALKYLNNIIDKNLYNKKIKDVDIYRVLSEIYIKQRNYDEALKACVIVENSDKNNYKNYFYIGYIMYLRKNYQKATLNFKKSLSINDSYMKVYPYLGISLFEINSYENSLRYLKLAKEHNNKLNINLIYYYLGMLYEKNKKFKTAKENYNLSILKSIKIWNSYENIAKCEYSEGNIQGTIDNY